ncbi:MAG: DMT family transporter [Frankiaceae bacterium]
MRTRTRELVVSGYGAGTLAGLVWGLSFPVPLLLHGWNAVTVTAGRYLAYGLVSLALVLLGRRELRRIAVRHWRPALAFAVAGNVAYYLLLVLGIQLAGAPVTDVIIGTIPVTMAVAGNLLVPAYRWRTLALPIALVIVGMVVINAGELSGDATAVPSSLTMRVLGIAAAFGAVVLWTWFGVANATFLNRHPDVSNRDWATVTGLATGVVTLLALPLAAATHQLGTVPGSGHRSSVAILVLGCAVLGVLVSWVAAILWNVASARMSSTAAGMMINVETLSGFAYVYLVVLAWPSITQLIGLLLILADVAIVVRLGAGDLPVREEPYVPEHEAPPGVALAAQGIAAHDDPG